MAKAQAKPAYHHGDLRQALVDAALAIVAERQDARSVSLREVARRVGVSQAAPYRHFADKEALLAAVAEEGFQRLLADLQANAAAAIADPLQRLRASGVAYVTFAIAHPAHYRVMFGSFQADNLAYPTLTAVGREAFAVMVKAIVAGQSVGLVKAGDPRQLARVTWSLVHGLAMLLIEHQLPITEQAEILSLAQLATATLVDGLQPSGPGLEQQ